MTPLPHASLGRYPLLVPLLGGIVALLLTQGQAWLSFSILLAASIFVGLWFRKTSWLLAAFIALVFALTHTSKLRTLSELRSLLQSGDVISLEGTLVRSSPDGLVRREFRTSNGARLSLYDLPPEIRTAQKLRLTGRGIRDREIRNPGEWSLPATLAKQGFSGAFLVESAEITGSANGLPILRALSEDLRNLVDHRLTSAIPDARDAAIIRGIVLGEKGPDELLENFRKTGTMHVFAVSGLHVGLVALLTMVILHFSALPKTMQLLLMLVVVFTYVLLTGLRPPAMRAALMAALFIGGFILRRRAAILNSCCAAALIVLALDGFQLWSPGTQLSFLVVVIIVLLEPLLWRRVEPYLREEPYFPKQLWSRPRQLIAWSKEKSARMLTVSLAAWTGSAPITAYYFGWFTPIAPLASVLMVVLAFVILAFSILSLACGIIWKPAGDTIAQISARTAQLSRISADHLGNWPAAWYRVNSPAPWQDGLAVFDVPYGGSAIHLDAGGGVLIDAGSAYGFPSRIGAALQKYQLTCDTLVATHGDEQHVGGLLPAMSGLAIHQVLLPQDSQHGVLSRIKENAHQNDLHLLQAHVGDHHPIASDIALEILYDGTGLGRADDRGLVLLLHWKGWRMLLTSDAGMSVEKHLLSQSLDLQADVWIIGRHVYEPTGHDPFVRAVNPRVVIASDTHFPAEELLPMSWRRWLEKEGIILLSQREKGAVFLKPRDSQLEITSFLQSRPLIISRADK